MANKKKTNAAEETVKTAAVPSGTAAAEQEAPAVVTEVSETVGKASTETAAEEKPAAEKPAAKKPGRPAAKSENKPAKKNSEKPAKACPNGDIRIGRKIALQSRAIFRGA